MSADLDDDGEYETELTEGVDFSLTPRNAAADGEPWRWIELRQSAPCLPLDVPGAVQVVGRFGWAETPSQVTASAKLIASRLFQEFRDGLAAGTAGADAGEIASGDDTVCKLMRSLDTRRRVA